MEPGVLHRVLTGTRVTEQSHCDDELESLLTTRREYRMQEMCVQYDLQSTVSMHPRFRKQVGGDRLEFLACCKNCFPEFQRSSCS